MIHLIFIFNKNINDIVRIVIVESPEKSGLLTDGATETEKHEIKKTRRSISWDYHSTCGCFIDSNFGFFIDTTCGFFIDN